MSTVVRVAFEPSDSQNSTVVELPLDVATPLPQLLAAVAARFGDESRQPGKYVFRVDGAVVRDNAGLVAALRETAPLTLGLTLGLSPKYTCAKILQDMLGSDEAVARTALFNLQKQIKDLDFFAEFMIKNGVYKLQEIITMTKDTALSYALTSLQNLLEAHNYETDAFTSAFINNLLTIVQKESLISVCRPATSIIIKLLSADPSATTDSISSSHQTKIFNWIDSYIATQPSFIPTLISRLSLKDYTLQITSMGLINSLLHKSLETVSSATLSNIFSALEYHDIRSTLVMLSQLQPESHHVLQDDDTRAFMEELKKLVVDFQRLLVKEWNRRKRMPVNVAAGSDHERVLIDVWQLANFELLDTSVPGVSYKWKRLGFEMEIPNKELTRVGVFGLEMMHSFVTHHADYFSRFMYDQSVKAVERRCPFGRACIEVLEILSDYWEISTGYTTTTSVQPLLLEFERVYSIALRLYFRLWLEMEAQNTGDDVNRVGATVRSHFKYCTFTIPVVDQQGFTSFEREMLSAAYSIIRERQLKELNNDEALLMRQPFRKLREKLYESNYEFIKEQRIGCLIAGAWFPVIKDKGRVKGVVRFYRLNPNRQFLHYGEFREPGSAPALALLPQKIEVSHITEVLTGLTSPIFKDRKRSANAQENPSLSFSIATSYRPETHSSTTNNNIYNNNTSNSNNTSTSLADFICSTTTQFSEWVDGFNMLLDRNICTQETAALILQLTENELKLSLLSVTGNALEIPAGGGDLPELPDLPPMGPSDFYYDAEGGGLQEGISGLQSLMMELSELKVKELLEVYDSEDEN
ncbi:ELMO/CED-12 family-domain-containing protein [Obelidium mucronatum]|nr:ELMO/CED-12 family-domain-containing protein [Obelidium mucronatum]